MPTNSNDDIDVAARASPVSTTADEGLINPNDVEGSRPIVTEISYGQPRRYRLQHGDHFDTMNSHNPWTTLDMDGNQLYWYQDWVRDGSESESFDTIMSQPRTAEYTKKLASLTRENLVDFVPGWHYLTHIPLMKDPESGDEYHIELAKTASLPRISCPHIHEKGQTASPLFLLHSRGLPPPTPQELQELQAKQERRPPRYAIQLGYLKVTTPTYRGLQLRPSPDDEPEPTTEKTDWNVVLDAEDENYSVWILVSRQQLKDHIIEEWDDETPPLPIFRGLMGDEGADYDCACILDSVHRLGLDNPQAPDFSEALDTIRSTRCINDPAQQDLPLEQLTKYGNNEPFDHPEPVVWPADPDLELKITHLVPVKQSETDGREEEIESEPNTAVASTA